MKDNELVPVSCTNPECSEVIWITKKQKRQLFLDYFLRYGRVEFPYCSKACQEEHVRALSASTQFKPAPIKDHGEGLIRV
jgi:hypothetical protein